MLVTIEVPGPAALLYGQNMHSLTETQRCHYTIGARTVDGYSFAVEGLQYAAVLILASNQRCLQLLIAHPHGESDLIRLERPRQEDLQSDAKPKAQAGYRASRSRTAPGNSSASSMWHCSRQCSKLTSHGEPAQKAAGLLREVLALAS